VSWLINGQDPAAASDPCTAGGVHVIRMTFVDPNGAPVVMDPLQFDCHLGSYRSAQPELRAGTWRLYWEALAPDGSRVSLAAGTYMNGMLQPTLESVTVQPGINVDFDTVNRPDATFPPAPTNFATGTGPMQVRFTWAQTQSATTGVDCGPAGVSTLRWVLRRSNGVPADQHDNPELCSAGYGALQWDRLDFDRYSVEVHGFDAAGTETWRGTCNGLLDATAGSTPTTYPCLVNRVVGP
jgi:hypothetical protein